MARQAGRQASTISIVVQVKPSRPPSSLRLPPALPSSINNHHHMRAEQSRWHDKTVPLSSTRSSCAKQNITSEAKQWPPRSTLCKHPAVRMDFLCDNTIEHFFHSISSIHAQCFYSKNAMPMHAPPTGNEFGTDGLHQNMVRTCS